MFWGKGDSSKLSDDEKATLEDLRRLVETGHLVALTPEQTEISIRALNFYASVYSASSLLVGFRNVLVFVGAMLAIWWAGHDAIISFIQTVAAGAAP